MFDVDETKLTAGQRAMLGLWQQHLDAEFTRRDAVESCDTMMADATVNHVPVLTGGRGRRQLEHFYARYFIPQMPPDVELAPLARTVGDHTIVDEFIFRFTHSVRMDWLAPGVEATGRRVEIPMVVVVEFRDGKIAAERIYWDQASVLVQLGLLAAAGLPVVGVQAARKALDSGLPSNELIKRHMRDENL
jgi:carboxymethylenebutenolidase